MKSFKRKKYPKRPKNSASPKAWERWSAKVEAIDKYNNELDKRETKIKTSVKKAMQKIGMF